MTASKKNNHEGEEPVGWVTVKGVHFPKWADGSIGWQDGQEDIPSKTTTKESKKPLTKKEQYKQYKDTVTDNIAKLKDSKDLSDAEKRRLVDANKKLTSKMSDLSDDHKLHSKLKVPSQYKFEKEGTYTIHDGNTKRPAVYKHSEESLGLLEGVPGSEYTTHVFSDPKNPKKRYYIHEDELMKNSGLVSTRQAKTQSSNARYDTSRSTKNNKFKMGMSKEERKQFLDDAPVGTKISGLIDKRTGRELIVEKHEGYSQVRGGVGAGSKVHESWWSIAGEKQPYMARILREAEEGTSKYYEFKKLKGRKK